MWFARSGGNDRGVEKGDCWASDGTRLMAGGLCSNTKGTDHGRQEKEASESYNGCYGVAEGYVLRSERAEARIKQLVSRIRELERGSYIFSANQQQRLRDQSVINEQRAQMVRMGKEVHHIQGLFVKSEAEVRKLQQQVLDGNRNVTNTLETIEMLKKHLLDYNRRVSSLVYFAKGQLTGKHGKGLKRRTRIENALKYMEQIVSTIEDQG